MAPDETVPDLLRRFTPTPHHLNVVLMGIPISVQTNDPGLISRMQSANQEHHSPDSALLLKLIRDFEVLNDSMETTLLSAGALTTMTIGGHSMITFDCERREILGFLSASISADLLIYDVLPALLSRVVSSLAAER